MEAKHPHEPCAAGDLSCGDVVTERNRYFTGKYMTARDFQADQDYFLSHHRLHNRLFHGWGIGCGLEVIPHNDRHCRDRWVIVCPGIAIDCCGRELVIDKKTPVKIWKPPAPQQPEEEEQEQPAEEYAEQTALATQSSPAEQGYPGTGGETAPEEDTQEAEGPGPFLLYLRYVEKKVEYVPALYAEGECDPARQEANRIREEATLEVIRWEDVENSGWRMPEGDPERRCRDDCADPLPGPAGACMTPECPTLDMVPLAIIQPRQVDEGGYVIDEDAIDTQGQRKLPQPADFLTHIVHINWPHGGTVDLADLRRSTEEGGMGRRLEIHFDRKLLSSPDNGNYGTGVNAFTFVVQYGGVQQDVEHLRYDPDSPPTIENDCVAVFTIHRDYIERRQNISGNMVYVTLKCNFILDCHGNPVDGDYLGGRLPSGDGIPGGAFESWFYVGTARRYREEQ